MPSLPHLPLPLKVTGRQKPPRFRRDTTLNPLTAANLAAPFQHGARLNAQYNAVKADWEARIAAQQAEGLPVAALDRMPIFLKTDSEQFSPEQLRKFGIEVIAENAEGYILGATTELPTLPLLDKISKLMSSRPLKYAAGLWEIVHGERWRIEQILSTALLERWDTIADDEECIVELGVACFVEMPPPPTGKTVTLEKEAQWQQAILEAQIRRDNIALVRQDKLEELVIGVYGGEFIDSYVTSEDSFSCQIRISGKGLKDIVLTYPFLFEVTDKEAIDNFNSETDVPSEIAEESLEFTLAPNAAKVCVIDSGLQESHKYLQSAVITQDSHSYLFNNPSVADEVRPGGHGTRVAGAILYPSIIPRSGTIELGVRLQNARVLDARNELDGSFYLPALMERIVNDYHIGLQTRLFNLSITSRQPCTLRRMSAWATSIDQLQWDNDILFFISAGNISRSNFPPFKGIRDHFLDNTPYPEYLLNAASSRIANPAQSCFSITVGSISHHYYDDGNRKSISPLGGASAFSRSGFGMWGMIKPDVVEYGGDYVKDDSKLHLITTPPDVCPELIQSTLGGGVSAIGKGAVGTSFAAPKVAHIAAQLQRIFPHESTLLYRALIAQSARWPDVAEADQNPLGQLRMIGYGIPDLARASENTDDRITFIASNEIGSKAAHIYHVKIPDRLRAPGQDYNYRVDVTLSFKAKPKRTRYRLNSYLSTWLSWEMATSEQSPSTFQARIISEIENDYQNDNAFDSVTSTRSSRPDNNFAWKIGRAANQRIRNVRLRDSTLQKDWALITGFNLPEVISIAVIGHAGWEKNPAKQVPYSIAITITSLAGHNIYEAISIENPVEVETQTGE